MTKHELQCEAPICVDNYTNDLVWYAGEEICKKSSNLKWHIMQKRINKYLAKGNHLKIEDTPLDVPLLETRSY
jgi:hypothetical protein